MKRIECDPVLVVVIDGVAHMLGPSFSRCWLIVPALGVAHKYFCCCCCSDDALAGLNQAVHAAQLEGATLILMRSPNEKFMAGIPVADITDYVKTFHQEGVTIHCP